MAATDQLVLDASPFPLVDLDAPAVPTDGLTYPRLRFCERVFEKGKCREFYASLKVNWQPGSVAQCPYGFSACTAQIGEQRIALTGIIPFPRSGGDQEKRLAKQYPKSKVAVDSIFRWASSMSTKAVVLADRERAALTGKLQALHEVRRFNQIVKATMERICDEAGRGEPLRADPQLVRAWKASELISLHMNALDLISNPSMLEKKPHKTVGFYKIADKLYQIYKPFADDAKVSFCLTGRSFRKVLIDDGTFHIVMSVFIDNAIKYSKPGDRVEIQVLDASLGDALIVGCKVISLGPTASPAEERLFFTKQLRTEMAQQHTSQGSGIGLVLAKRVADQHRGTVRAKQVVRQEGRSEWTFLFQMIAVSE